MIFPKRAMLLVGAVWFASGCNGDAPVDEATTETSGESESDTGETNTAGTTGTGTTGTTGTETETETAPEPACGDGDLTPGEFCDDGNQVDLDGCNSDCRITGEKQWELVITVDGYDAAEPEVMLVDEEQIVLGGTLRQSGDRVAGFVSAVTFDGEVDWIEVIDGSKSSVLSATKSADGTIVALTPGSDPRLFGISPAGELLWQTSIESTKYVAGAGDGLVTVTGAGDPLAARYTSLGAPLGPPFEIDPVGLSGHLIGLESGAWIVGGGDGDTAYVASYGADDTLAWSTPLPEANFLRLARDSQANLWVANNDADIISGDGGQLVKLSADGSIVTTVPFEGYFQALGVDSADYVVTQDSDVGSDDLLRKRDANGETVWSMPVDERINTTLYAIGFRPSDQQMIMLGSQSGGARVLRSSNR